MGERESLRKDLEQLLKKRDSLKLVKDTNPNEIQMLEEQIESGQANMNYIQVLFNANSFLILVLSCFSVTR